MNGFDIYCYGMIVISHSLLLEGDFLKPDQYSELAAAYSFPGGETGTCATVLASLGADVKIDGTHIGGGAEAFVRNFYGDKSVELGSLCFDSEFAGLEDYVIVHGDARTPMGTFGDFFARAWQTGTKHWNKPKETDIADCKAAAIDPFFGDDSDLAAEYCVKHGKPYVTIDCKYDSFIHRHAEVSVISGESIRNNYPGKTREELSRLYFDGSDGLTIITNGSRELIYGRKGERIRHFTPYKVENAKTLGAGDTFKAGCAYALMKNMTDDELVSFASACAAAAISKYPLQLNPPGLDEVQSFIESRKTAVNFYDGVDDAMLKFAVIISKHKGKYVFCKHKERETLEVPGGHREAGEAVLETAQRELYEETGAVDFDLKQICVYSVTARGNFDGQETFGMLYFADIREFEPELHSEIEGIVITDELPEKWTYPEIQPRLMEEAERRGALKGF